MYVGIEALVDEKYDGGIDRGAEIMFVVGCGAGSDPVAVDDGSDQIRVNISIFSFHSNSCFFHKFLPPYTLPTLTNDKRGQRDLSRLRNKNGQYFQSMPTAAKKRCDAHSFKFELSRPR